MKPRDWVFIAIVIGVVGGLYFLSQRSSRIPNLPSNPAHAVAQNRDACLQCHTPEKMTTLADARKHPLKWRDARISCTQCHKTASPQQAQAPQAQPQYSELSWLKQH